MVLAEVVIKKKDLKKRVFELEEYLVCLASNEGNQKNASDIDSTVSSIYLLIDEIQQHVFTIDKVNNSVEIKIGNSTTTLSSAIRLRNTVNKKIGILDRLIGVCKNNNDSSFSIISLLENKDKLLAEFNLLNSAIKLKDWSTRLMDNDT